MKIRTKFLAAVLATATAFSCALTASAFTTNPGLTLQGNESSPLTLKNGAASATFTLKASDFREVKGAKITVELPASGMTLSEITVSDADSTWTLDKNNYKVDGNKITMVDVFNFDDKVSKANLNLNLSFNVAKASIGEYQIKVTGDFADNEAAKVYTAQATANFVIGREETSASSLNDLNNSINAEDYFIPYGGAYIGPTNLRKGTDGKFLIGEATDGNIGVLKCKLPVGEAVTTFGVSKGLENFNTDGKTAIQFGTYVNSVNSNYTYGTLFIAPGNVSFEEAIDYYKGKGYDTEAKILGRFIEILTTNSAEANTLHTIKFNNKNSYIKVAYVPQFNYMWKDSARGEQCDKLQYAVRYQIADTDDAKAVVYTAAGYYRNAEGTYNFSTEIKSSSYNDIPNVQ